jgi:hypothetical protein
LSQSLTTTPDDNYCLGTKIGGVPYKQGAGTRGKKQKRNLEIIPRTLNLTLSQPRQRFWSQFLFIILYNCTLNCTFHCLCNERSSSMKATSSMPSKSTILQSNLSPQHNFKFKYETKNLSPYNALKPSQVNKIISYIAEGEFTQIARNDRHRKFAPFSSLFPSLWTNDLYTKHLEKIENNTHFSKNAHVHVHFYFGKKIQLCKILYKKKTCFASFYKIVK